MKQICTFIGQEIEEAFAKPGETVREFISGFNGAQLCSLSELHLSSCSARRDYPKEMKMRNRNVLRWANKAAVLVCLLAVMAFLAGSWQAGAQTPAAAPGNLKSASPEGLATLVGHTPRQVLDGTAMRVSHYNPEQKLRLALAVRRPHPAEEEQFLTELQTIGSPNFHQFLSAEEWIARFGPSVDDEQKIVDWATSQGLTVTNRFANRLLVDVEAPAGVIENALGVTINNYQVGGEVDFANDRDPQIPAHLSGILNGVLGLNSIVRAHRAGSGSRTIKGPDYVAGSVHAEAKSSQGAGDPTRAPWNQSSPMASDSSSPRPGMLGGSLIEPTDIQGSQGYDYAALSALGHCCNPHGDASGSPPDSSIAIYSAGGFNDSDVQAFFKSYGMAWNYTVYAIDGYSPDVKCTTDCTLNGDDGEGLLDLAYSTAMANSYGSPNDTAHVYVYEAVNDNCSTDPDLYNLMLSDGYAKVLTSSYTWTEGRVGCGDMEGTLHGVFNSMTGTGWTLVAAAGDDGSTDYCGSTTTPPTVSVGYPSSDPNFVSVGGTILDLDSNGNYVSEVTWNSGSSTGCWGAGGGGVSTIYPQPSWQNGLSFLESTGGQQPVTATSTMRLVPDIALNAGAAQYLYDSTSGDYEFFGTSIGAPELAGFFAQENAYLASLGSICGSKGESACDKIGNANPLIYNEAINKPAAHYPFYDITSGCNYSGVGLALGLTDYCAGPGYDTATGWGSINMLQLAWALNWEIVPANGEPYVTFSGPATNTWYNTSQTVNWTINDYVPTGGTPGVGIAGFTQGWDSIPDDARSEPTPGTGNSFYSGPEFPNATKGWLSLAGANGSGQGCHSVHVRGWNNQGLTTGGQPSFPEIYGPLCYDTVPPTIAVANNPSPNANGWNNAPVTVTITATDPGGSNASGVAAIYVGWTNDRTSGCKPGNTGPCEPYDGAFTVSSQGAQVFNAFSEDKAGNFSTVATETIRIDTVAPVTKASYSPAPGSSGWNNTPVTVTLSATDNLSGVNLIDYWLDNAGAGTYYNGPFSISTTGKHTVYFQSTDNAGNVEAVKKLDVKVDVTPPVTVATPSPAANSNGWNKSTVKVTLSATDVGSGVANTTYWLDNPNCSVIPFKGFALCQTYTAPFSVSATGKHTVYFNSVDKAGNVETTKTLAVNIDEAAPVTKASLGGVQVGSVYQSTVTVTLTVSDDLSGVAATYYTLDGGSKTQYPGSFMISTVGTHTLDYWSVDNAGNKEKKNVDTFAIASSTTTTLTSSPNPSVNGQTVTLKATVAATDPGTPTGTVTFVNGATVLGAATVSSGVATLTTSKLPVGSDGLAATYNGATNFLTSTSAVVTQVVNETTTTTLTAAPNPAVYGSTVTLSATVKPSISGVPAGAVQFMDGATALGTETLNGSGVASLAIATLAAGGHSITATYSGGTTYTASTSAVLKETVDKATSATALKSSTNSSSYDEPVTFMATVTSAGGTPTGNITFLANGKSLGSGSLVNGVSSLTTSSIPVGTNSITATYSGSDDFSGSSSSAVSLVTTAAATTTQVASSLNPSSYDEAVTFTATVTPATAGAPAGTVTFLSNGTRIGTGTLSSGVATFKTTALAVGTNSITAAYAGNTDYKASTSAAVSEVTNAEATTTVLTSSLNPSTVGVSVTFTATVKSAAAGTPAGTVTFMDGSTSLGVKTLSDGTATLTTKTLASGENSITAVFSGSTDYLTSTSAVLTQTVNPAATATP